jgi:hypothetical protein
MKYPLPLLRRCFAEVRLVLMDNHRNMLHYNVINANNNHLRRTT